MSLGNAPYVCWAYDCVPNNSLLSLTIKLKMKKKKTFSNWQSLKMYVLCTISQETPREHAPLQKIVHQGRGK